jgi:TatD DNase family protein
MKYYDAHAHTIPSHKDTTAVLSIDLHKGYVLDSIRETNILFNDKRLYSIGIHPRYPDKSLTDMVGKAIPCKNIAAVGETGLDKLVAKEERDLDLQKDLFYFHIELSEKNGKPLIIHCVKAWEQLLRIKKEAKPSVPWIVHGFRGKPDLAGQLLKSGCYLSFGDKYNAGSAGAALKEKRLFLETDDTTLDMRELYKKMSVDLNIEVPALGHEIEVFFKYVFL